MPERPRKPRPRKLALRTATLAAGTSPIAVDREAGIIRNVAVITVGSTKPNATSGGSVFDIDTTTLDQVAAAINVSEIGLKCRMTHPELEGIADDLPARIGYVRNARTIGQTVRADIHLHDPTGSDALKLMDIAEHDPASAGLSVAANDAADFQLEPSDTSTGLVLRVAKLDAVDFVGEAAANPAGLLSALTLGVIAMNQKQLDFLHSIGLPYDATDEQTAAFIDAMSDEHKDQLKALKEPATDEAVDNALATASDDEDEDNALATASDDEDEDEDNKLAAGAKPQPKSLTLSQVREELARQRKAERARVQEIRKIGLRCGYDEKWIDKHINDETSIGEVRRLALASLPREPSNMPTSRVQVGADLNRDSLDQAVQDALLLRAGAVNSLGGRLPVLDSTGMLALSAEGKPQMRAVHERATQFRGHKLIEMGRRYLLSLGYDRADSLTHPQLADLLLSRSRLSAALPGVYLAHATGDFPHLLADTMGKILRTAYNLAPATWRRWARRMTAPDFKDVKLIQLGEAANLVEQPEGDDVQYGILRETQEVIALRTYAKGIQFTRRMLINDDLSAFDRVPRMQGQAADRNVESLAIAVLTSNPTMAETNAPLFATAHGNLTTGVLNRTNLGVAKAALRRQAAFGSSDPLELEPRILLVPETISTEAETIVGSSRILETGDTDRQFGDHNPFHNRLEVVPSARLDLDSDAQWYLSASPDDIDTVVVMFLEGEEAPVLKEEENFDNDTLKMKVRQEAAVKAVDYRGLVRSSGA